MLRYLNDDSKELQKGRKKTEVSGIYLQVMNTKADFQLKVGLNMQDNVSIFATVPAYRYTKSHFHETKKILDLYWYFLCQI